MFQYPVAQYPRQSLVRDESTCILSPLMCLLPLASSVLLLAESRLYTTSNKPLSTRHRSTYHLLLQRDISALRVDAERSEDARDNSREVSNAHTENEERGLRIT